MIIYKYVKQTVQVGLHRGQRVQPPRHGRPALTHAQSEEEIKKFELEEGLTELDNAKILLKKKNTAQMVSVSAPLPV